MPITVKKDGKFEYVYIKNAIAYYASVHEAKLKYQSTTEREYSITLFIDKKDADKLENEVLVNKTFAEVGVTRNKKRKIKYPLLNQEEEGKGYDVPEGMIGFTITAPALNKKGNPTTITVIDKNGEQLDALIGNGSKVDVKAYAWRNQDDLLNIRLQIVKVNELVEYSGGSGEVYDEEFGVTIKPKARKAADEFEDDIPFDTTDENDEDY